MSDALDERTAALMDGEFIAGAKAGYNLGISEDSEGLAKVISARSGYLGVLQRTRPAPELQGADEAVGRLTDELATPKSGHENMAGLILVEEDDLRTLLASHATLKSRVAELEADWSMIETNAALLEKLAKAQSENEKLRGKVGEWEETYIADARTINELACKWDDAEDAREAAEAQLATAKRDLANLTESVLITDTRNDEEPRT